MKRLRSWVRLPSRWIEERRLREFRWARGEGADNAAALMVLAAISHHADDEGVAHFTYDQACAATSLSRSKVSAALQVLTKLALLERGIGRSSFRLTGYDVDFGWAKFPAAGLYRDGAIAAFERVHLRHRAELDALKLYYLFASRRDRATNAALITYETIEEYSGVARNNIRTALSWLAAQGLVHIDHVPSAAGQGRVASAYRLAHLDSRRHMGTIGRSDDVWQVPDAAPTMRRQPSPDPTDLVDFDAPTPKTYS